MPATRLTTKAVEKPWGRTDLWPGFEHFGGDQPVGEIWFQGPDGHEADLLVKYLFTSEKLSVQVHPDDAQARARGHPRGKDEAWLILAAAPGTTIALGPNSSLSPEAFRAAIADWSIADLLDWRPVRAGDFIYSPAGTVHAIGAGLTVIEVQQNLDLTYRLFDYGRPRELHVEEGTAVSILTPFAPPPPPAAPDLLAEGPKFVVERLGPGTRDLTLGERDAVFVPVKGQGAIDGAPWRAGECWRLSGAARVAVDAGSDALLAYSGAARV